MKLPARITCQLRDQFGLDESVFCGGSLNSVVRRRLEANGLDQLEDYFDLLLKSNDEFLAFADELLVPESWFFRDVKPFLWLTEWARKVWLKKHPGEQLRILSVPCATGQEPYSIVMALLHAGFASQSFHVEAGDLSQRFIDESRRAEYRPMAFRGDAAKDYAEYFEDAGNEKRRVREIVRKQVHFKTRNLLAPDFLMNEPPFHAIFCRNVLIYFSACSRERAVAGLMRGLAPDGVLFGGHADALGSITQDLQPVGPAGAFCFQRRALGGAERIDPQLRRPTRPVERLRSAPPKKRVAPLPKRNEATGEIVAPAQGNLAQQWTAVRELANGGRLQEAEALASTLIKATPPSAEAFCTLGEIYVALRDYKQAEPLFRRAVYLDARHADSLFHLALLADRRGDATGAERLRKRARAAQEQEVKA